MVIPGDVHGLFRVGVHHPAERGEVAFGQFRFRHRVSLTRRPSDRKRSAMYLKDYCGVQFAEVWLKLIGVLGTGVLWMGLMVGSIAEGQVVPPAQTIPEAPSLQNETLKPLDYRNKYDVYGGLASSHFNAGPALIPGANLGGFDIQGTMWLNMRLGVTANVRGYYGTTGVVPNPYNIHGPLVYEHMFMGGASFRGPKNEHAALNFHALVGGSYGVFNSAINSGITGPQLGLFNNGFALATALGG